MKEEYRNIKSPARKYVVYDPPKAGLPYIAALFRPDARPRVFIFHTLEEAKSILTSNAIEGPHPLGNGKDTHDELS